MNSIQGAVFQHDNAQLHTTVVTQRAVKKVDVTLACETARSHQWTTTSASSTVSIDRPCILTQQAPYHQVTLGSCITMQARFLA
ncbi:hypothetical protein TNCV_4970261 [Trichonephila clavipes]|nr:hypothetical protein TNCV_4970261 [Trichonephila clavipes]